MSGKAGAAVMEHFEDVLEALVSVKDDLKAAIIITNTITIMIIIVIVIAIIAINTNNNHPYENDLSPIGVVGDT